ncbi:Golgin subfamily A member 3 [Trichoplax sp. H2]|nr:Golgin subfamily A member 3 [Trichoplax sp. H2]|eukprot:RDD40984.1 Golgin subfamily A member 3 [Trichoplax sp. H2]
MTESNHFNGDSQQSLIERELARTRELLNGSGLPSIPVDQDVIERELARGRALLSSRSSTSDSDMAERVSGDRPESDEDKTNPYEETSAELIVIQLEGQLESISYEHSSLLDHHSQLQNKYVIAREKLKNKEEIVENAIKSKDELSAEIDELKLSHSTLDKTLQEARSNVNAKEKAVQALNERLNVYQFNNNQLEQRLATLKVEIQHRDATVTNLQQEMELLQHKWDECITEKVKTAQELKAAHSVIESLQGTQDWLQKQLKFTQDARNALDSELASVNKKVAEQSKEVNHLRTENDQLLHDLDNHWQSSLKEKKQLVEYLSLIETDMLAREAAMKEATASHDDLHQQLNTKLKELQIENDRLQADLEEATSLENQLNSSKNEVNELLSAIERLNEDKRRLEACLQEAEQCVKDHENNLQLLQAKCSELEEKLNNLQQQQIAKDAQLRELMDNIEQLRSGLQVAQDEKQAFTQAMESLQCEMNRVKDEYDTIERNKEAQEKQLLMLQQEKEGLRQEIESLQETLDDQQKNIEELTREHYAKETQVEQLRVSRATVESELQVLKHDFDHMLSDHAATKEEKDRIENQMHLLKDRLEELSQSSQAALSQPLPSTGDKLEELNELKIKNEELENRLHKAGSESRKELTKLKAKIARLTQDLQVTRHDHADQHADYKRNLALKESECQQLQEENRRLIEESLGRSVQEGSMQQANIDEQLPMSDQKAIIESIIEPDVEVRSLTQLPTQDDLIEKVYQVPIMESTTDSADLTKISQDFQEDKSNIIRPTLVDNSMQTSIENITNHIDIVDTGMDQKLQQLSSQLEREKGRRKGLEKIQSILRQHSGILQSALGKQELALEEIIVKLKNSQEENQSVKAAFQVTVNELQQQLDQKDLTVTDLNDLIISEKKQNADLNQRYNQSVGQIEDYERELENKRKQLESMRDNLDKMENNYITMQQQYQETTRDSNQLQIEADATQRALDDKVMKLQALQLDIDSLKQQLILKQEEVTASQQELEQLTDQHQVNNKRMQERIDRLEVNLNETEKDKQKYGDLIKKYTLALQRCKSQLVQVIKHLPSDVADKISKELELDTENIEEYVELLWSAYKKQDTGNSDNRSINTLQNCLSELRQEMATLQERMDEHKKTVYKVVYSQ